MRVDQSKQYEVKLQKLINSYLKKIQAIYHDAIVEVSLQSTLVKSAGKEFNFDLYPSIKKRIDKILTQMQEDIESTVINSVSKAWKLSNQKNDQLAAEFVGNRKLTSKARNVIYNPNLAALKAFLERKEKGLNLSKRVWNLTEPYKYELEAGLKDGIGKGESAAEIATKLKRYLNDPDKLFRRVRDKNGKLQLSRAAQAYHPGQGVYRSSYQNALRLTATETNISYRKSDSTRWQKLDFVKGIKINLSASHVFKKDKSGAKCKCEICEQLTGLIYPKDFVFTGWHPRCKCYPTTELMSKDDFNKLMDFKYGRSKEKPSVDYVNEVPKAFTDFVNKNRERIAGWSQQPYWMRENPQYVNPDRKPDPPSSANDKKLFENYSLLRLYTRL